MAILPSPAPIKLPTVRSATTKPSSVLSLVHTNHRVLSKLSFSAVYLDLRSHGGSRSVSSTSLNCLPSSSGERGERDEEGEEVERALGMDGSIPGSSQEFVRRVSSRAYDMRRNLIQSIDSLSYDGNYVLPFRLFLDFRIIVIKVVFFFPCFCSIRKESMEGRFKTCLCANSERQSSVDNENTTESQVRAGPLSCMISD